MVKRILIISDTHLGSPNSNYMGIIDVLDNEQFDELYINGDFYDHLNLTRLRKMHRLVVSKVWGLIEKGKKVYFIDGNHDKNVLDLFNNSKEKRSIFLHGYQIDLIHGHQFDSFIRKYPLTTSIMAFFYYLLQRIIKSNKFSRWAKYKSKSWINVIKKIECSAFEYCIENDCHAIICGHTHHQELIDTHSIVYMNTGSFMDEACEYGIIELHDYKNNANRYKIIYQIKNDLKTVKEIIQYV